MTYKYTKFGKNLKTYSDNKVWNYVALDPENKVCMEIRFENNFKSDLPGYMMSTSPQMFDANNWTQTLIHEEISEKEFWAAYKLYMTRIIEHFKSHTNGTSKEKDS